MAFADNLNSVCLVQDSSCSSSLPSSYKGQAMLKCITCVRNTYLHGNTCTTQCPTNFTANANNHCMCSDSGTLTVDDQCLPIPVCPIKMGWDSYSSSCLRC